jgi:hypothetical protein
MRSNSSSPDRREVPPTTQSSDKRALSFILFPKGQAVSPLQDKNTQIHEPSRYMESSASNQVGTFDRQQGLALKNKTMCPLDCNLYNN